MTGRLLRRHGSTLRSTEGLADFPVMSEWIEEPADTPAIRFVGDGADDLCASDNGAIEDGVGIIDGEDKTDGTATQSVWAEVEMLGGLVRHPEVRAADVELRDDGSVLGVEAEDDLCSEGGYVEVHGPGGIANGEHGG